MHHPALIRRHIAAARRVDEFITWLAGSGDELVDAALLLGGSTWGRVAANVVARASQGHDPSDLLPQLRRLRRLLQLELAADLASEEAERFMALDPDDPRADSARICAEALDHGIRALELVRPVLGREAA
ncbi:hypothetical protein [uncultured Paracoccus sp.]|uniref:hypothetical protein n=1 Tax=uncultured Paracoccus sp. TaxID=189685 RepID=UPI002629FFE0|nr:hypothetical protein [uncultured Paracoccus sp.]